METETSEGVGGGRYEKCLRPGCENLEETRGLCNSCYATALRQVRLGRVTWEQLERAGKTKPKKIASAVTKWIVGD